MTAELLPHCDYPRRAKIERLVSHLHHLGPRPLAEFLNALSVEHGIGAEIAAKLEDYRNIDPVSLRTFGGDRFAAAPLHAR